MSRRRDGARNFFPMPQKIFNLGMNAGEIAVYAYLMFRENRKTYQCYPSYRTIGEAVGMSKNTVKKYVDMGFTLDERICDGFYYASILKYMKRIFNDPYRLDNPPETVVEDIP